MRQVFADCTLLISLTGSLSEVGLEVGWHWDLQYNYENGGRGSLCCQ